MCVCVSSLCCLCVPVNRGRTHHRKSLELVWTAGIWLSAWGWGQTGWGSELQGGEQLPVSSGELNPSRLTAENLSQTSCHKNPGGPYRGRMLLWSWQRSWRKFPMQMISCQSGWASLRSCSDGTEEDRRNWWGRSCSPLRFHNPPAGGAGRVQTMTQGFEASIKVKGPDLNGGPAERRFHHKHAQDVHGSSDRSVIQHGSQQQQEHIHLVDPGRSITGGGRNQGASLLRHYCRALFQHIKHLFIFFCLLLLYQSMNGDDFLPVCRWITVTSFNRFSSRTTDPPVNSGLTQGQRSCTLTKQTELKGGTKQSYLPVWN